MGLKDKDTLPLADYLTTVLKIKRNLVGRLSPETDYCKGYSKAVEDTLELIEEYQKLEELR